MIQKDSSKLSDKLQVSAEVCSSDQSVISVFIYTWTFVKML